MKLKTIFLILGLAYASSGYADVRCGDYLLTAGGDGFMHINGVRPETQKLTFLGASGDYDNVKMEWRVATNQPGKWLGMEYVKRGGTKRFLNVQLLQASMDAPRQYATYDCVKVK
ncbi:hypothetical protein QZQ06_10375 [Serratia marcescens]|uniref:hypothetical protein n=1 Tax=Serratia marcescens TaxID=615 RepID=UPI0027791FD7|nr:hypothetical protein [Serratia marcescens]MDP8650106.1 hypothetical protein [Serratia marcescens]MDP8664959.1 hypothetical protein [Serratia marcescens]MDP8739090.1 hypothetical protein [Serratia marcescens]MDP8813576.1 hypothetical protein [Serratia marcescens]HEJ7160074.1 hypothetical protein [Serratia marcescens]